MILLMLPRADSLRLYLLEQVRQLGLLGGAEQLVGLGNKKPFSLVVCAERR